MKAVMQAEIGHRLALYTMNGKIVGTVWHIFEANHQPDKELVKTYYGVTEDYRYFNQLCSPLKVDRIVLSRGDGTHFIVPRTPKADRFILQAERLS
jgi:hypothetical protein